MGLTDYAYGGDYGGTWVGTETAEQYALQYDADSRIATVYNGAHTNEGQQYYYDADSQLLYDWQYSGYGGGSGGQYTSSDQYGGGVTDYDANGNPDTSSGDIIGAGNRLLSDGTYNYTYDLAGNMLSQTNISTGAAMYFGYDADNRMVSVVMKNGSDQETAAVAYTYDMYGDLIGRTVTGYSYSGGQQYSSTNSNSFVYDLATGQMVLEFSGGTLENRFLYGPAVDQILAQENVSSNPLYANTSWMVTNYQGSVVDELYQQDTAYGVDEFNHVAYNAFGAVTSGYAAQFGYDGTYTDPVTGLQLHDLRWYSTTAQRWTQPDPSGLAPDSNPNRYVGNDPMNGTDPTGLAGEDDDDDDARESAQAVQQAAILRRNAAETGELQLVRAEAVKAGVDPAIIAKVDEEVAPRVQAPETPPDEEDPLYDAIVTLDKAIGEKEAQDAPAGGIRISPAEYARYKADEAAIARAADAAFEDSLPRPITEGLKPQAGWPNEADYVYSAGYGGPADEGGIPEFVVRGDVRPPDAIFKDGFQPLGTSTDIKLHIDSPGNPPSIYVSASTSLDSAAPFGETSSGWAQAYIIETPPNAIDVQASGFGTNPNEGEILMPGGVGPSSVAGVTMLPPDSFDPNTGTWHITDGAYTIVNSTFGN